jgi:hypothetical protein
LTVANDSTKLNTNILHIMLSTQITIGALLKINVQAKSAEDLFREASLWYELPCKCGKCDSQNIGMRFRQTKDYDFYELKCLDCEATFALGQKKEANGGGLYPRGDKDTGEWEVKYEGGDRRDDDRGRDRHRDERGGGGRGDRGRDDRRGSDRERVARGHDDRGGDRRGSYRKDDGGGDGPINDY